MAENAGAECLTVCALASGSRGNALYIADGETAVLVDVGLPSKEIVRRMSSVGLSPKTLKAILVSHEHGDHIRGVGVLARRFGLSVHIAPETLDAAGDMLGHLPDVQHFEPGTPFRVHSLSVHPFSISHDAANPVGFTIGRGAKRVGIATDLGIPTHLVKSHLETCDILILEANHDPDLLMNGPYPWHLKQRIRGRTGHLSNAQSRDLLREVMSERVRHIVLGHLSEQNNTPQHALTTVGEALQGRDVRLTLACQHTCGELIRI